MGLYITLRDPQGAPVEALPDPSGGTFDACGDFDGLLHQGRSPVLDAIDPHGTTTLPSSEMKALATEVAELLASVPGHARGRGQAGTAWRGLNRFRVMVDLCQADSRLALKVVGD